MTKKVLLTWTIFCGTLMQASDVLAPGRPPLTQAMVRQLAGVFEFLLDVRLSRDQQARFEQGMVEDWRKADAEAMENAVRNLRYAGQRAELESLRQSSQQAIVDSLRLDQKNAVSRVLVEAYDAAHPDRSGARLRGMTDLTGTWKRQDALLANRGYDGRAVGVAYTDTATLEVQPGGAFRHVKAHNHCSGSGGCCRLNGSTEIGVLSLDGARLVFTIQSGTEMVLDGCMPNLNQEGKLKPRVETVAWSIRLDPNDKKTPTLCWNTGQDTAVCYTKQ